jgi:group I intron endonuclease
MKQKKISGIYKITSPTGRVYIGQAVDLKRREIEYKCTACKGQPRLYKSIIKYGWEAHQFDIIEYCGEEELNCSERFWQDIFNVLDRDKGLNCVLTECGAKRYTISEEVSEKLRAKSKHKKKTINTKTLKIYDSVPKAFEDSGEKSLDYFSSKVSGRSKNNTYFMYLTDYEKYGALVPDLVIPDKTRVINTLTLQVYESITHACKDLNLSKKQLSSYLSGKSTNKTYCIYEKDYIEGVIHYPKIGKCNRKVVDELTNTVYENSKDASVKTNIPWSSIRLYLSGRSQKNINYLFKYIDENNN